jgi:hypothetical protein
VTTIHGARRWAVAAALAVMAGALAMSTAWACVPLGDITLQPRSSGTPGAQLTVVGANFEQNVELRWNAVDGPLLASAPKPSFSVPITLPDVADGLYVIVAVERGPGGVAGNIARAPVQVARGATPTATTIAAKTTARASSSTSAFAVTLGVAGALALLAVGGMGGYRMARRRGKGPSAPVKLKASI